jgi:hypothetical protein
MDGWADAFEEAGIIGVLDYMGLMLVVERHRPPSIIARTLINDGFRMLDDFAREYRGYVGKVVDHVCEELRSLLYEILGGE